MMRRYLLLLLVWVLVLGACTEEKNKTQAETPANAKTYTCPMHPQVVQHEQSTCPVCGMDLVLVEKSNASAGLQLDARQIMLANIATMPISNSESTGKQQLNGRLVTNPDATTYISSTVEGRLDWLFVKQTGAQVKKGQPLYQIYSEQLASLQQEYLLAVAQAAQFPADKTFAQILRSARQKLSLYGQSETQIRVLEKGGKINPNITFFAPESGTVAELSVNEGQYVSEGSPLLRLEGYQSLWVEADIYASETGSIKPGQQLQVVVPGWETEAKTVKVAFVNPALEPGSQLVQIRAVMPNPREQWQPGLQAKVYVLQRAEPKGISLPEGAVIHSGQGTHIWVETKKGYFEPRVVETGEETESGIVINSGLQSGDKVVVSGAYLLYSEYILKKGKDPMSIVH